MVTRSLSRPGAAALGAALLLAISGCGRASRPPAVALKAALPEREARAALDHDERGEPPGRGAAYAALEPHACARALASRRVPFTYVAAARGVGAPIRLTGPVRGVDFHGEPRRDRLRSPYEILDCRLALALADFAEILARHDVVEVVHMSMYRPPPASAPLRGRRSKHEAGLAIDLGALVLRDGTKLSVLRDFHGALGAPTCGPDAGPTLPTEAALTLRRILCDAVRARLFQVVLTPNHDRPHANHFHLEVRAVPWSFVE